MNTNSRNIYQTARLAAGITQERAAELIGTSVRSIAAYEASERIPADDIVVRMADVYGTQFLVYQHVRANVEAAKNILPNIDAQSLPLAILRLQKELSDFIALKDEMVAITCDGIIDASEQARWDAIMKELDDVNAAIMSLKFSKEISNDKTVNERRGM